MRIDKHHETSEKLLHRALLDGAGLVQASFQDGSLGLHARGHRNYPFVCKDLVVADGAHTPSSGGRFLNSSRHALNDSKSSRSSGSSGSEIGASID